MCATNSPSFYIQNTIFLPTHNFPYVHIQYKVLYGIFVVKIENIWISMYSTHQKTNTKEKMNSVRTEWFKMKYFNVCFRFIWYIFENLLVVKKKQFDKIAYHLTAFYCNLIPLKKKKTEKLERRWFFFRTKNNQIIKYFDLFWNNWQIAIYFRLFDLSGYYSKLT